MINGHKRPSRLHKRMINQAHAIQIPLLALHVCQEIQTLYDQSLVIKIYIFWTKYFLDFISLYLVHKYMKYFVIFWIIVIVDFILLIYYCTCVYINAYEIVSLHIIACLFTTIWLSAASLWTLCWKKLAVWFKNVHNKCQHSWKALEALSGAQDYKPHNKNVKKI